MLNYMIIRNNGLFDLGGVTYRKVRRQFNANGGIVNAINTVTGNKVFIPETATVTPIDTTEEVCPIYCRQAPLNP